MRGKITKNSSGITIVTLVVTIVILLILSGITINTMFSENGIIERAEETKLRVDYSVVKRGLEIYKLNQELISEDEILTDESLIGSLYKKIEVRDTKRELVAIADFAKIGVNPTYGKGIEKIIKDDNNSLTTVKQVDTLNTLRDIYVVDLADGSLYYINGDQIYTEDGKTVEVAGENGTTINKYEIETINPKWYEIRKFKTKWDVTLGETEGSSTFSTVVLPADKNYKYNATIEWGDGTSTTLQHRANGITLTDAQLTEALTHNYAITEGQNTIYEISISGTYSWFDMKNSTTKLKLIGLEQWGDVNFTKVAFSNCTNLAGNILKPNIEGCFSNITNFSQLFTGCSSITGSIPELLFESAVNATSFYYAFSDCKGLTGTIPEKLFSNSPEATTFSSTFANCKGLTGTIPENLFKYNTKAKTFQNTFRGCSGLTGTIPENLFATTLQLTNLASTFYNCSGLTKIPANLLKNQTKLTNLDSTFFGCTGIKKIEEGFYIPDTVTNMTWTFINCSALKGTMTIKGCPTSYSKAFSGTATKSGGTLTVNYTEACTNIDEILATGNSTYVVKGILIPTETNTETPAQ